MGAKTARAGLDLIISELLLCDFFRTVAVLAENTAGLTVCTLPRFHNHFDGGRA